MKKCGTCGTTIILGGKTDGSSHYCSARCLQQGVLIKRSRDIPAAEVQRKLTETHSGLCPKCHGTGPVDVHVSHRAWSALVVTGWSSRAQVCCQSCGTRAKLMDSATTLLFGWWGIPWGLLMTPIQIGRNVAGLLRPVDTSTPSPRLENAVRMHMAIVAMQGAAQPAVRKAA
jgi:hypothetical protein